MKVKLVRCWGQYPPGQELDMPAELAETLVRAKIARKLDVQLSLETAEALPLAETAARTRKPVPRKIREAAS